MPQQEEERPSSAHSTVRAVSLSIFSGAVIFYGWAANTPLAAGAGIILFFGNLATTLYCDNGGQTLSDEESQLLKKPPKTNLYEAKSEKFPPEKEHATSRE